MEALLLKGSARIPESISGLSSSDVFLLRIPNTRDIQRESGGESGVMGSVEISV